MISRTKHRPVGGFTLIELLVVIAIIGVLIALLIPAVQKVRESANRVTCTNNVKQFALAVHNYTDATNSIPQLWYQTSVNPRETGSLFFYILPYMEQQPVYDAASSDNPAVAALGGIKRAAHTVNNNIIKSYVCPSDPTNPSNRDDAGISFVPG